MRNIFRVRLVAVVLMAFGLLAGGITTVAAQADATPVVTPDPNTSGTVNISVFACTNVTDTVFQSGEVVSAAAIPSTAGDCAPSAGTFTFYFIGDQTADFAQLFVDGSGSIGLPAGDYEVVQEENQARTTITVVDGGVLTLVVTNPVAASGATPVPVVPVVPTAASTGGNTAPAASTVSSLPNTGQGSSSSNGSTIVLLFGAMSLVALAAGFAWRQRRAV